MNEHEQQAGILYTGKIVNLRRETITLPNGTHLELEIVDHPGGAAVVAVDEHHRVCLLRQYRHIAGGFIWELPAGKIDDSEPPFETARRELADEAGVEAKLWISLGTVLSSPGIFNETIHLWLAQNLVETPQNTEADEVLEAHWVEWQRAIDWARKGEIRDAKTLAGLMRAGGLCGPQP